MQDYVDIVEAFMDLFNGLERAHGRFRLGEWNEKKKKHDGMASTIASPTIPEHWRDHFDAKDGLGIIPIRSDNNCYFGAIDIDDYALDIKALSGRLHKENIPVIICRTKSGGAHLYMFMKEPVAAKAMKQRLLELADYLGYPDTEVFPKQEELASENDVGNWINMPYYDLDQTLRYGLYNGQVLPVRSFIERARAMRLTIKDFDQLKFESEDDELFTDAPPCLRKLARTGIPDGARNKGLFNIGVYCRLRYGDNWESMMNQMNVAYVNPPLEAKEVVVIVKSLNRKKYFYTCNEPPIVNVCNKQICRTKKFGIGGDDAEPSFVLGTLVKIDTEPPTWFIDVDGGRIELTTDDLLAQDRFRKLVVEKLNKLPRKLKPAMWDKIIQERLQSVEVVEAPHDISPAGRFLHLLEQFLGRPAGRSPHQLLTGKTLLEDGEVIFRGPDLISFLDKQGFKELKARQVYAVMRNHYKDDIKHFAKQVNGQCVQCWSLPAPPDADEAVPDIPDLTHEEPF